MAHVDRYVDQAVTRGTAPFYPVPPFLAGALRQDQPWSVNEAGIARALKSAQAIRAADTTARAPAPTGLRSEEHTSELQSPCNLVCRLLLEKKKKKHSKR